MLLTYCCRVAIIERSCSSLVSGGCWWRIDAAAATIVIVIVVVVVGGVTPDSHLGEITIFT